LDPVRLEETVAAQRSRQKVDFAEYRSQVADLAVAAKKARRACELAESWWRQHPSADSLAEAKAGQQARSAAVEALREFLLHDAQLIGDVQRRYGR
jgi:hypothetical protein